MVDIDSAGVGERFYHIKDHLGSVRITLDEIGTVVTAQDYAPYGSSIRSFSNGYPNEKYKFNERERDTETGYDYGLGRIFMFELGIWGSVDPMNDMYHGWSPYHYVLNNPVRYIDPTGMYAEALYGEGDRVHQRQRAAMYSTYEDMPELEEQEESKTEGQMSSYVAAGLINTAFGVGASLSGESINSGVNMLKSLQLQHNTLNHGLDFSSNMAKTNKALNVAKGAGYTFFVVGTFISAWQFAENPTPNQGLKSSIDVGMGAFMTWGGVPGLMTGGIYYGVDMTLGWGNVQQSYIRQDEYRRKYGFPLNGLR